MKEIVFSVFLCGIFFSVFENSYYPLVFEKEFVFYLLFPLSGLYLLKNINKIFIPSLPKLFYILFFLSITLSLLGNINNEWFIFYDYFQISGLLLLFFIIYQFFADLSKKEISNIFKIFITLTFIQKIISIFQFSGFLIFAGLKGRTSITGLIGNPNILSYILVISAIISYRLYKDEKKSIYLYLAVFDCVIPFALFSRGAMLGILFLIYYHFGIRKTSYFAVSGVLLAFGTGFRNEIFNDSIIQRIFIWKNALYQFYENWFTGIGLGNFKNAFPYYNFKVFKPFYSAFIPENTYAMQTHNDILQYICETGIFGLAAFSVFLYFILKKSNDDRILYSAIYFSLIFSVSDFPIHNISSGFVFIMIFSIAFPKQKIKIPFHGVIKHVVVFLVYILILKICYSGLKYNISYIYLSKALKEEDIVKRYRYLENSVDMYQNAHAYYEKGNIELLNENNEKAVESFTSALVFSGQSVVRSHIANIFYISEDLKSSLKYYIDAWEKDPFNIKNLEKVIEICEKLDEREKAMYYVRLNEQINYYRKIGGKYGAMEVLLKEIK